ncbi:MAG TPA: PAS domain S-box protein [Verrucomicrobiae bacterium]|nr:PAS domain S-box protein [Verrucomicrobiae bacterium]
MPYVASGIEELSGLRPAQLAADASPLFRLVHPNDINRLNQSIRDSAKNLTPWRAEFRIWHHARGLIWLEGRSVPEREADGSTLWHGFVHEITERKVAEAAVLRLSRQNELILESAAEGILGIDRDGNHTFANRAAAEMLGYNVAELIGRPAHSLWHDRKPDGTPNLENGCPIVAVVRDGIPRQGSDQVLWRKDGTSFIVEYATTPIHEEGRLVGAVVTFSDITSRTQAEKELNYHKALLEETGRTAKVGGWDFDPATGAGHWTDEVARIHELDPSVKPNVDLGIQFYEGESRSRIQTAVREAIELGKSYDLELAIRTAKGNVKWVRTIGHPIVEDGKVVKVAGSMQDITERKRTEESLLDLQRQQRALLDNIPDIAWVKDRQGRYLAVNDALCKAYRRTAGEVVGSTDFDMVPRELAERYRADDLRVMESRKRERIEEPFEDATGHRTWIETIKTPILDNCGAVIGTAGIARDITERKESESQLRLQSAALHSAANGIVITDREGRIVWVNRAFTQLTGYTADEAIGQTPHLLKSGKHDAGFYRNLWETISDGRVWRGEMVNRRKDGSEYTEEMTITPIRGIDGAIERYIAVKQDVTERKQANLKLLESEERFREFAENVDLVFWIASPDGSEILYVNRAFEKIWGVAPEQIYRNAHAWIDGIHPEDRARVAESFGAWLAGRASDYDVEYRIVRPDGQTRWIRDWGFRIRNPSGQTYRVAGIAEDITEDKHAERELAEMEVQLQLAQKLEAIGRLAAGVAHEINTPNQYIGDNTRFLQESFADLQRVLAAYAELREAAGSAGLPPNLLANIDAVTHAVDIDYLKAEIPKAIEQTLEGVDRVAKITRAMKEFSHPGSGEKVSIDLNHAIETTVTIARNEWKYVANLATEFDDTLPRVPCLVNEFNQVILNIVVNAAHAIADVVGDGRNGKGTITVSTRRDNGSVEVRITDTGMGIPEAARGKIFDPFFTTKPVGKGSGQGLAIARSVVVDKHHGEITFETELNKGTTFIIRLPLASETSTTKTAAGCEQTA